jgi:uncharacterized membrane protein HdeD (DUF308 family)
MVCSQFGDVPSELIQSKGGPMIVLGIILLVLGYLLHISILSTIGIILLVIGVVLLVLGAAGRGIGGRRHYF